MEENTNAADTATPGAMATSTEPDPSSTTTADLQDANQNPNQNRNPCARPDADVGTMDIVPGSSRKRRKRKKTTIGRLQVAVIEVGHAVAGSEDRAAVGVGNPEGKATTAITTIMVDKAASREPRNAQNTLRTRKGFVPIKQFVTRHLKCVPTTCIYLQQSDKLNSNYASIIISDKLRLNNHKYKSFL
jgi:hypothetical protein